MKKSKQQASDFLSATIRCPECRGFGQILGGGCDKWGRRLHIPCENCCGEGRLLAIQAFVDAAHNGGGIPAAIRDLARVNHAVGYKEEAKAIRSLQEAKATGKRLTPSGIMANLAIPNRVEDV